MATGDGAFFVFSQDQAKRMSTTATDTMVPHDQRMSLRAAAALARETPHRILKYALAGTIRSVSLPGVATFFIREDIEKLVKKQGGVKRRRGRRTPTFHGSVPPAPLPPASQPGKVTMTYAPKRHQPDSPRTPCADRAGLFASVAVAVKYSLPTGRPLPSVWLAPVPCPGSDDLRPGAGSPHGRKALRWRRGVRRGLDGGNQ